MKDSLETTARAYRQLLELEIVMREVTRSVMSRTLGQTWYRRIPGPCLTKIRQEQSDEASRKHFGFLKLGPLYYLTLGELLDILKKADFRVVVDSLGTRDLLETWEDLLPIRNAICHARSIPSTALSAVSAAHQQLLTSVGDEQFQSYLLSPDSGIWPEEAVPRIAAWLDMLFEAFTRLAPIHVGVDAISDIRCQFWWDKDTSDLPVAQIDRVVKIAEEYQSISGLGSSAVRQKLLEDYCAITLVDEIRDRINL